MRTRSVIIIGFVMLLTIFGIASVVQWQLSQEMRQSSEYHISMIVPAFIILDEIRSNFQALYFTTNQIMIHEVNENHNLDEEHQILLEKTMKSIDNYSQLAFVRDSKGDFIATPMMQKTMQNYASLYKTKLEEGNEIYQQIKDFKITHQEAEEKLEIHEKSFRETIEENSLMEINEMQSVQNKLVSAEKKFEIVFFVSTSAAIVTAIIAVLVISRFVSKPIGELAKMTNKISKGEFVKLEKNYNNSDVNEILDSLNKMSEDLEKYKSEILKQEKLSSIGELSSRLAHDIRNPLTVIKGTLDFIKIKNKNLTPEDIEKFDRIDTAIYRMTHQIDNVLDFIKGKPLKLSLYPLQEIIDSVLLDISKPGGITIQTEDTDIGIECDSEAMKIVLINLIVNAIQSIGDKGVIKISSKIEDDKAIITVADSGPEIPESELANIFEPLYTTKQEGTGLGLASCKSLVEQHHGTITFHNNPKRFEIVLPQIPKIS